MQIYIKIINSDGPDNSFMSESKEETLTLRDDWKDRIQEENGTDNLADYAMTELLANMQYAKIIL